MLFNAVMFHADSLVKVLASGGSVLLPVDTAGRVLELLLILDKVKYLILLLDSVFLTSYYFIMCLPFVLICCSTGVTGVWSTLSTF